MLPAPVLVLVVVPAEPVPMPEVVPVPVVAESDVVVPLPRPVPELPLPIVLPVVPLPDVVSVLVDVPLASSPPRPAWSQPTAKRPLIATAMRYFFMDSCLFHGFRLSLKEAGNLFVQRTLSLALLR